MAAAVLYRHCAETKSLNHLPSGGKLLNKPRTWTNTTTPSASVCRNARNLQRHRSWHFSNLGNTDLFHDCKLRPWCAVRNPA